MGHVTHCHASRAFIQNVGEGGGLGGGGGGGGEDRALGTAGEGYLCIIVSMTIWPK